MAPEIVFLLFFCLPLAVIFGGTFLWYRNDKKRELEKKVRESYYADVRRHSLEIQELNDKIYAIALGLAKELSLQLRDNRAKYQDPFSLESIDRKGK